MRSASAATTATRSASPGARAAIVRGSSAASTGSISTPTTWPAPASSRASVSEPSPGPTSSTTSCGSSAASAAIRRTVPGSTTKFWPSRLDGRTPSRPASSLISPGVSSRTPAPSATTAARSANRHDVTSYAVITATMSTSLRLQRQPGARATAGCGAGMRMRDMRCRSGQVRMTPSGADREPRRAGAGTAGAAGPRAASRTGGGHAATRGRRCAGRWRLPCRTGRPGPGP